MWDLKKLRRAAGLSQFALARKSRVPRWRIAYCETQRACLTEEEWTRIVKALAVAIKRNFAVASRSMAGSEGSVDAQVS